MAHQGHSFATAQEARVVYRPNNDTDEPVDVPKDGKTVGEVVMRGNVVMKEVRFCLFDFSLIPFSLNLSVYNYQYFRDPDATSAAFRGGNFNSGDLAVMYPDGSISIIDRSKDIIISGGEVSITFHPPLRLVLKLEQNTSSLAIEQGDGISSTFILLNLN